jgi:adenylylsulfate kinase
MMKKNDKNRGYLFWITGLSGSGKTQIGKQIFPTINKKFGPTLLLHGDDLRKIFGLKGYSRSHRIEYGKRYIKFINLILNQNINVILTVVGLFDVLRKINQKKFKNYIEIFIKTDLKKIIKFNKKKIYKKKTDNIMGVNIKAEFPKKPHIVIKNNFDSTIKELSEELIKKISKKYFI